ncbi:amidohydrolase [Ruicaihuangia caeni]|uniref:amidohydrolase n=1 Tax=Ruicaihuangia caeni TaxID=3042517 RepID=UPI00338DFAA2
MPMSPLQRRASEIVEELRPELSEFHRTIWSYSESAWREYRSVELYVDRLREEGFRVEEGSGGMPTAFHATWGDEGPEIGMYAEYDATPGYCQDAATERKPREGLHQWAPGFTDAHSALGVGALAGAIATKRALEESGQKGRVHLFGEPAEKVCGSKAVHAAKGYYDSLDAVISYHPFWHNTALWDITNNLYWSAVFTFQCPEEEPWGVPLFKSNNVGSHNLVRSPGAIDALSLMINTTKVTRENMFPATGSWTLNEAILGASTATADNLAPRITQIQFSWRSPLIDIQEQILGILKNNAKHVAGITNTEVTMRWVTRTRPGLPNHALTTALYDNLSELGAPTFEGKVVDFANELERNLGFEPSDDPFLPETMSLVTPQETDKDIRFNLPPWQECTGADDYTEYSWHAPTVRFFTAKPFLKQLGIDLWHWANNAMNGVPEAIDPCWERGAQTIASTAVQLVEDPELLKTATAEFDERRSKADERLLNPLLPKDFNAPIELPWPEYVQTKRGFEWTLPTTDYFGEAI